MKFKMADSKLYIIIIIKCKIDALDKSMWCNEIDGGHLKTTTNTNTRIQRWSTANGQIVIASAGLSFRILSFICFFFFLCVLQFGYWVPCHNLVLHLSKQNELQIPRSQRLRNTRTHFYRISKPTVAMMTCVLKIGARKSFSFFFFFFFSIV